jgi:hypothetical protein
MFVWFILPLILLVPIGIYLYFFLHRLLALFITSVIALRVICLILTVVFVYIAWPIYELGGVLVAHFVVISLVLEVIYRIFHQYIINIPIIDFMFKSGIISILISALFISYGFYNMDHVVKKEYQVTSSKVDHLKIGLISDLHFGMNMNLNDLENHLCTIENEDIDMLLLVGDIFDERTTKDNMIGASQLLSNVHTKYGVYYVSGNHDPNHYAKEKNYTFEELLKTLRNDGIYVLEDEIITIDNINIVGRIDASMTRKSMSEFVQNIDLNKYTIVLDHQPVELQDKANSKVDLTVSGHTHAGQIWPTGTIMQLFKMSEFNYGYERIQDTDVIVSSGIAGWGYPIRTGGHSEYVIINVN